MRSASSLQFAVALAAILPSVTQAAGITDDTSELAGRSFDYVIVGGGTAGLVLAGRLTENANITVAVLEAGTEVTEAAALDSVNMPAQAYFDGIASLSSPYDWHYQTTAQADLGGKQVFWPRGKLLGGSSAVNGLYMVRGSAEEYNSWGNLVGNATWGWDEAWPYMQKSENYTAPLPANQELANVIVDEASHGQDGPIHYSYPGFFYPQTGEWIDTLSALGVESRDPAAGGKSYGAFIATSAINPTNWSRSYSRTGYLDPHTSRSNLFVLTGVQATKIVLDGTRAIGVEFSASANGETFTVSANQEVILSSGVIGTPQLLQLSGIGDSAQLGSLGIPVVKDLPGVGMHLTDHLSASMAFSVPDVEITGDFVLNNATFAAEQKDLWRANDPSSLYNSPNHAIAYVNLTTLMGSELASDFIASLTANQTATVEAYSSNAAIQRGYAATYAAETDIYRSAVGQAEILLANTGTYGAYGDQKTMNIQAAIQHPLSRGSVLINSTSAFDPPVIDAGYLTHPGDIQVLIAAFKFARMVSQTQPLAGIIGEELTPGDAVETDAQWEEWIRQQVSTEYHASSTASMLPEESGGVVDTALRVYGITGLRVVDASVIPVGMSAHMAAPVYGLAEKAVDVILSTAIAPGGSDPSESSNGASSSTSSSTSTTRSSTASSASGTNSATNRASANQNDTTSSAYAIGFSSLIASLFLATASMLLIMA